MITTSSPTEAFAFARRQTWLARLGVVAVLTALLTALWFAANYHSTTIKKEAPVSLLLPVEAPPPPPPPPKPVEKEVDTTPLNQPVTPTQTVTKDNAITENADAQAGGDAFNIGSGSGEGLRGSGVAGALSRGPYANYLAGVIKRAVHDSDLTNKAFRMAVAVWLSPAGKIIRIEIRQGTGSAGDDKTLQALLLSLPALDQPPPQSILDSLPINMTIDLRKSL